MQHARETAGDADDDSNLHVAKEGPDEEGDPSLPLAAIAEAVSGRVTETIGILQDDDEKIAEGKTAAAAAVEKLD